ncbi:hypothetical protein L6164_000826 [Bauhinia variegata]|uniref:Uncharacterized protein n=1 Tax=Bauhinia variegata TaxID=167791 RepID=A0ACB9Q9T1_BAUVA|nr:hypothetical protein L6164_000826 [Bauhinia variegata]
MDYLAILLLVFFSWALIHNLISINKRRCLPPPPGPRPFPIIGNILVLGSNPHQSLAKLSKTFGPIMSLKLGSRTTIIISSLDMAKEVLKKKDQAFSSRTVPDVIHVHNHHKIPLHGCPLYHNGGPLEELVQQRYSPLNSLTPRKLLDRGKCRSCWILWAKAVERVKLWILDAVWRVMEEVGKPNVVDFFPILRPFDPQRVYARTNIYFGKLLKYFDGIIEERIRSRASKVDAEDCNDVLDSFLINISKEEESSHLSHLDLLHLVALADGLKLDMKEKFGLTLKMANPLRVIPIKA